MSESFIYYWNDSQTRLTVDERKALLTMTVEVIHATSWGMMLRFNGREVVVRNPNDPLVPKVK